MEPPKRDLRSWRKTPQAEELLGPTKPRGSASAQLEGASLNKDVIAYLAELTGDTKTALAIAQAATELKSIADRTDLNKLKEFCETHWDFKTEWAIRFLMLVASGGPFSSVEELKKSVTEVSGNLSPEEALKQLVSNWKLIEPALDALEKSFMSLAPYLKAGGQALALMGCVVMISFFITSAAGVKPTEYSERVQPALFPAFLVCLFVTFSSIEDWGWEPITNMRSVAQHFLENIEQDLKR